MEFSASTLAKLLKLKRLERWQPTDLPQVIADLCDQYGVRFIDLTPALIKETIRTGQLLYNPRMTPILIGKAPLLSVKNWRVISRGRICTHLKINKSKDARPGPGVLLGFGLASFCSG